MNCFQRKLPITEGEPHVEVEGEVFHASQIQCSVAIERERCAKIAERTVCKGIDAITCISLVCAELRHIAAAIRSGK